MMILFLPFIIFGISYAIEMESYLNILSSLGVTAALSYLFSQIGRDSGKRKENELWDSWGGTPTEQLFSYKNDIIDEQTKNRYHQKMSKILDPNITIDYKSAQPDILKDIYKSWTKYLIGRTRDTKKFSLLFNELTNYGFRRNLWGLKTVSLVFICICLCGNYIYSILTSKTVDMLNYPIAFWVSEVILIILILFWVFIINKTWVKIPAFSYAERLLETIDIIID